MVCESLNVPRIQPTAGLANSSIGGASRLKMLWNVGQMAFCVIFLCAALLSGCVNNTKVAEPTNDSNQPPPTPREFRAAWIATVANIDWPSKKGLPVEQQKQEIIRIVERAKELNLNALIFQVRPAADALYPSNLEPWSEYLTGEQGKAPEPFYDPLKTWIEEAHKRGIELHAWFNPYRARHTSAKSPNALSHIANTNPELVKSYGGFLWMDPGESAAAQRTLDVIMDVVRRYDIDGVHVDDYFYPYPVTVAGSMPPVEQDFPDDPAWQHYQLFGGSLARADWRRENVNQLIEKIYTNVHREKPWVRFGVSPFGIGRPDRRPPSITGFSQYDKLYADAELWLRNGWLDYLVPQLYWPIEQRAQAFEPLLDYWLAENKMKRHVWPGLFTSRIDSSEKSWPVEEILKKISLTRTKTMEQGHVHFSMVALSENRKGVSDQLKTTLYATQALVPSAPWLNAAPPAAPLLKVEPDAVSRITTVSIVSLDKNPGGHAWQLAAWVRVGGAWRFVTDTAGMSLTGRADVVSVRFQFASNDAGPKPDRVIAFAVDRFGNESARAVWPAETVK